MSTQTKTPEASRRSLDPALRYAHPRDLATDSRLSVSDRLELLYRWDFDVREQVVASDEGMAGSAPDTSLREIATAIEMLEGDEHRPTPTPTQRGAVRAPQEQRARRWTRASVLTVAAVATLAAGFGAMLVAMNAPLWVVLAGGLGCLGVHGLLRRRRRPR